MKIVLFDIDGTLLLTGGCGRIAFEKAFEELFGVKNAWQDLIPDGKTDPMIVEEIVSRTLHRTLTLVEYKRLVGCYHFHFEREIQNPPKFVILPGVRELLEALSGQKDCALGIATGNYELAAQAKLRQGKLRAFFSFGGYASDAASRVEITRIGLERGYKHLGKKIQNRNVFLIGDTPYDVHAGKILGLTTIAVSTGRTSSEEFREKHAPDYALQNLSDTEHFLKIIDRSRVRAGIK